MTNTTKLGDPVDCVRSNWTRGATCVESGEMVVLTWTGSIGPNNRIGWASRPNVPVGDFGPEWTEDTEWDDCERVVALNRAGSDEVNDPVGVLAVWSMWTLNMSV